MGLQRQREAQGVLLLVDDNPDESILARLAFEKAGLGAYLRSVESGEEAKQYLKGDGIFSDRLAFPFPRLLLMDMKMPGVSGVEVLKWVRRQSYGREVPVILLTNSSYHPEVVEAYECGATAFLIKPLHNQQFLEAIRHIKNFWMRGIELPVTPPFVPPPVRRSD